MTRIAMLTAVAVVLSATVLSAADAATEKIDAFIADIEKNDAISKEQAEAALATARKMRDDDFLRPFAITEALAELYPEFGQAVEAIGAEDFGAAKAAFDKLVASDDRWLAADASFFLGRVNVLENRFEAALAPLKDATGDRAAHTLHVAEALFLRGIAEARLLKRKEARDTFGKFIKDHAEAPERMKIAAHRRIAELDYLIEQEGTLADVFERMEFSRFRLAGEDSGGEVQTQQDTIIAMLDKLIKETEERECNCAGGGSGGGQSQNGGQSGGGEGEGQGGDGQGTNDDSAGAAVRRTYRGPRSPWGDLRDKERDPAYSAIKTRFPARFEKLIEQYYKSFQDDE